MNKGTAIKTNAVKGIAWLTLSSLILKFIGLIYKVPISYLLGDEGMGYFNSAYTVYTLFYIICSSGIPKGISVIVSKYEAEGNKRTDCFYRSTLILLGCLGVFVAVIFILLAPFFTSVISSSDSLLSMYAVAPSVLFVCLNGVARGYLCGKMQFSHIAISEIIIGACKLVLGLVLAFIGIKLSLDIPTICALSILGITIGTLASTVYLLSVCKTKERGLLNMPTRSEMRDLIKISIPITFASVGTGLMGVIDLFLIIRGLTSSDYSEGVANALYGNYSTLTLPMVSLVSTLIAPIITSYAPILTVQFAKRKANEYINSIYEVLSLVYFITIPCFFVYILYPSKLLGIIFESGSVSLGFMMLAVISPSVLFMAITASINNSMEATGRVRVPVISIIVGSLVKIAITYVLMRFTSLGILCAPIGTTVSYATSFVISYLGINRSVSQRIQLLKPAFFPLVASAVALLASTLISRFSYIIKSTRLQSIFILSGFGLIYIIIMLILSKRTRGFLDKIRKINKKI